MTQTCLKLSSLDNCQDLSGGTDCFRHHNIKENILWQAQPERCEAPECRQLPRHMCRLRLCWDFESFEDVWWMFVTYMHAILDISITKKIDHYKMGQNCLKPSYVKNRQDTYAKRQYTDTCGKFDFGWWMLVTCINVLFGHQYHKENGSLQDQKKLF